MKVVKFICLIFITASITWSCNQSNSGEQESNKKSQTQTQSPAVPPSSTGEKDQYGRNPGDQHYGHDHAPADNQLHTPTNTLQTPAGGPDKYGRNPGDQHYGHDHE